ncbi:hypothetical protein MAR_002734, partial [Mya arenaria]
MELYSIFLTPSGMCIFTIFNFNGTQMAVKISSTKGFEKAIIDGKAFPFHIGSVGLDFILRVHVNGTFVASCNLRNRTAKMRKPEFMELFGISITPSGWCIFTVFNFSGTQHQINISSTLALAEVFIEEKAYPECMGPSNLDFTLK